MADIARRVTPGEVDLDEVLRRRSARRDTRTADAATHRHDVLAALLDEATLLLEANAYDPTVAQAVLLLSGDHNLDAATIRSLRRALFGDASFVQFLKEAKANGLSAKDALDAIVAEYGTAASDAFSTKFASLMPRPASAPVTKMIPVLDADGSETQKIDLNSRDLEDMMRNYGYVVEYSRSHRGLVVRKPSTSSSSSSGSGRPTGGGAPAPGPVASGSTGSGAPASGAPGSAGSSGTGVMPPVPAAPARVWSDRGRRGR